MMGSQYPINLLAANHKWSCVDLAPGHVTNKTALCLQGLVVIPKVCSQRQCWLLEHDWKSG